MADLTQPLFTAGALTTNLDNLIAGDSIQLWGESGIFLTGQNLVRGALVGKVAAGAISALAATTPANTGNATISAVTAGAGVLAGIYRIIAVSATRFIVEDPLGFAIGVATAGSAFAGAINFTITAGGTPMVAGDSFNVTVAAGTNKWVLSLAAAADGSQDPLGILAGDCDATSADRVAPVYRKGVFNSARVVYGTGHTLASVYETLLRRNILLVAPGVPA